MEITYRLIRSKRKSLAIEITPSGEVIVRCPKRMRETEVRSFVYSKENWIRKHLEKLRFRQPALTEEELAELKAQIKKILPERVARFAPLVGVTVGNITVRAQRTRWGSCSSKGNLNFNCLLMLAPENVLDYVVVHELCHRIEGNHSARFWAHVERVMPQYRTCRKWLKDNGSGLIARLPKENRSEE